MKVSIVIPAFDQQKLLLRSLETLYVQRHEFHECIVIDDGSRERLGAPKWVRLERLNRDPEHRGSSYAKNYGAALAEGDTLVFADADILHMPDAIRSLKDAMDDWEKEGTTDVLLNVMRVGLPQSFPLKRTKSMEALLTSCRSANLLVDEIMKTPRFCWEQNCGMIPKEFFTRIKGYDAEKLKSWGFNNHDLCLRVAMAGGRVSSFIKRAKTGLRLHCFHMWHEAARDMDKAKAEFISAWGEEWSTDLVRRTIKAGGGESETRASS